LQKQIKKYHPKAVSVKKEEDARFLQKVKKLQSSRICWGDEGNCTVATLQSVDKVVIATTGLAGIRPTLAAIKSRKTVALATKEVLVAAGEIVMREAKKQKVSILPIDSEHSAIFQCLSDRGIGEVRRIILTASGGPFRGMKPRQLKSVGCKQALKHPNWKMGKKITIDSATLMNKGFEVIEALWLFGVPLSKITVVVHPQSVVHSAVEFIDGSIIAQIGPSDMRLPIQFALLYPGELQVNSFKRFSFGDFPTLSFEEPDRKTFRCLDLAYKAILQGKSTPAVLTAANDIAVEVFLLEKLPFWRIPDVIESTLAVHKPYQCSSIEEILEVDRWAREIAAKFVVKFGS
jgi:1-deoxy-D-xylulose-5-phosphate reductoisomerase